MERPDSNPGATERASAAPAPRPERTVTVGGTLPLSRVFTATEAALIDALLSFAEPREDAAGVELREALERGQNTLATIALALESYPSLKDRHTLGGKERSYQTLLDTFVEGSEHGLEWVLPSKAVLARSYGIAKVNFFSGLQYAVQGLEAPHLLQRISEAIEEAVYTRLAEELYASFISSRTTDREVKVLASKLLVDMWEGRVHLVTTRFCPLLRSAWAARMRAPRVFGTLLGTSEIVQLLFQDCDEQFVSWFSRHEHDSEQRQAFEEFLFDLPFESLEEIRQRMKEEGKTCVGPREVERYLALGRGRLRPLVGDAKGLYVSFRRRRVKAQYRTSMRAPGPKRTAEAYILEGLLREEAGRTA